MHTAVRNQCKDISHLNRTSTDTMCKGKESFCKSNQNSPVLPCISLTTYKLDDWVQLRFYDEHRVNITGSKGNLFIWKQDDEQYGYNQYQYRYQYVHNQYQHQYVHNQYPCLPLSTCSIERKGAICSIGRKRRDVTTKAEERGRLVGQVGGQVGVQVDVQVGGQVGGQVDVQAGGQGCWTGWCTGWWTGWWTGLLDRLVFRGNHSVLRFQAGFRSVQSHSQTWSSIPRPNHYGY